MFDISTKVMISVATNLWPAETENYLGLESDRVGVLQPTGNFSLCRVELCSQQLFIRQTWEHWGGSGLTPSPGQAGLTEKISQLYDILWLLSEHGGRHALSDNVS